MKQWGYYIDPETDFCGFLAISENWQPTEGYLFALEDKTIQVLKDFQTNPELEHYLFFIEISGKDDQIFADPDIRSTFGIQANQDPSFFQPRFKSRWFEQVYDQAGLNRMFPIVETH